MYPSGVAMEPTRTHLLDLPAPCFEGQPPRTEAVKPWRKRLADACGEWDDLRPPRRERQPAKVNHETAEHVRARLGINQTVTQIAKALGLAESDIEKLVKRIKDKATPARKHSCASKHSPARKSKHENEVLPHVLRDISAGAVEVPKARTTMYREPSRPPHCLDWQKRQEAYLYSPMGNDVRLPKDKQKKYGLTPEQAKEILSPGRKRTRHVRPVRSPAP